MSDSPRPRKLTSAPSGRPAVSAPARPAFGAPSRAPAPSQAPPAPSAPVLDKGVFEPDPVLQAKQEKKSPAAQARAQAKSRQEAIHSVHMIRLLAPAIARAMAQGGGEEDQVRAFVEAAAHARDRAQQCVKALPLDEADHGWVAGVMERVFLEHPSLAALEDPCAFVAALPSHLPPPPSSWLPLGVAAPVALLQALGPVSLAQQEFPLGRTRLDDDLTSASRLLAEAGQDAVLELVDPTATSEIRTTVFCSAVAVGGESLAYFWKAHGQALAAQAQERTHAQVEAWQRAHPQGEDLEPVFQSFREHAARLRRLARAARPKA